MDVYKTPEAVLNTSENIVFSPFKAIMFGLCISIILASIVSMIESIAFGIVLGVDFNDQSSFESALANSTVFLVVDIVVSSFILFFAGKSVGRRVPGKEEKYGIIVSLLTLFIYLPLYVVSDAFSVWPIWYNLMSLTVVLSAIYFGAKSIAKA